MRAGTSFDTETIRLLRRTLDRCWAELGPYKQAQTSKTVLAGRILAAAADGERDPYRLRTAAMAARNGARTRRH